MEIPASNGTLSLYKSQNRLQGTNRGIATSVLRVKETTIDGNTLLSLHKRGQMWGGTVQNLADIFNPSDFDCLSKCGFKSKVVIQGLKQSRGGKWRFNELDKDVVKEKLNFWLLKTQSFWNGITIPLGNTQLNRQFEINKVDQDFQIELDFMEEQTIDARTLKGYPSPAAVNSIEQFSRLNGLTGRDMQAEFEAHAPVAIQNEARNLVEYCCFYFLSRDGSDVHPAIKDVAFRHLMFITMLGWQHPYLENGKKSCNVLENSGSLKRVLVGEEAFVRIAPAIAGVADRSTVHTLFRALVRDKNGLSFDVWNTYLSEIMRVHQGRELHCAKEGSTLDLDDGECILCVSSSSKKPILKWEKNIAWLGRLTLTDRALYFEANDLTHHRKAIRLDLTKPGVKIEKTKVGPLGVLLFDSAISVSNSSTCEAWILEFIDLAGEMQRDLWYSFIKEIVSVYAFIREYGPEDEDPSLSYVYGATKGKSRAVTSAVNGISRLQALQAMQGRTIEDPIKFLQFSCLKNASSGSIVYQTLAVEFWGGCLEMKSRRMKSELYGNECSTEDVLGMGPHAVGSDGSIFLHRWMRSLSWGTRKSITFWKHNSGRQALVLGRNLVVGDLNLMERAVLAFKETTQMAEKTQATIDAALLKGIPSNIDLFKEVMLPFVVIATNLRKLRRWEQPPLTISFLAFSYTLIYKNWLRYTFPILLMVSAATMLMLKGLKAQGWLGKSFGRVTIQEQPSSNTIQKIISLKEALAEVEHYLQKLNVALLKLRMIVTGQTQVTSEVAFALVGMAVVLLIFPFRFVCAFVLLDQFTCELKFRQNMVLQFVAYLKDRWATIPAAPVVVLPSNSNETSNTPKDVDRSSLGQGNLDFY